MCFPKQHEGIPQFPNTPESRGHWNEQAPQRIPCKEGVLRIEGGHHAARQHNRRGIYIECNVQRLSQTVDRIHVRVHVSQALHNPTDSISIAQDWAIENRTLQQENIATLHKGCMSGSLQPLAMALTSTNESGPGHVNLSSACLFVAVALTPLYCKSLLSACAFGPFSQEPLTIELSPTYCTTPNRPAK